MENGFNILNEHGEYNRYLEYYGKDALSMFVEYRSVLMSEYILDSVLVNPPKSPFDDETRMYQPLNHPHRYTNLIRENEKDVAIMSEGLIDSFPVEKVISKYVKYCESILDDELIELGIHLKFRYDKNNPGLVGFNFPMWKDKKKDSDTIADIIKCLSDEMFLYGWGLSASAKLDGCRNVPDDVDVWYIQLEEKFSEIKPELSDVLYHIVPSRYIKKVMKNGLIPRSKSDRFSYTGRVYLFNNADVETAKRYALKKISDIRKHHPSEYADDDGFYLLSIKKDNLLNSEHHKTPTFYLDSCYDGKLGGIKASKAIFTYDNIPIDMIEPTAWYYEVNDDGEIENCKEIEL